MSRHHSYFGPYFASERYQESNERKLEMAIENKCKSLLCLITRIWTRPPDKLNKIVEQIKTEDQELLNKLEKQ